MKRRFLQVGLLGLLGLVGVLGAVSASSAAPPPVWNTAKEVPGTGTLNTGGNAELYSVSCATAGNCSGGGWYKHSSHQEAFVVTETDGSWGTAIEVPETGTLNIGGKAAVFSVSCATALNCTAGGEYTDGSGHWQAFVVNKKNGNWGKAIEVPGTADLNTGHDAVVQSLSCAKAGYCTASGTYSNNAGPPEQLQAFVADERNGRWHKAIEVPGTGALNTDNIGGALSVSCATAGNCAAGGYYTAGSGNQAFVADEEAGSWNNAIEVPNTNTLNKGSGQVNRVSCATAGNCSAGGYYEDGSGHLHAFVANETSWNWGLANEVLGTTALDGGNDATVLSVSCPTAGGCSASGEYGDGSNHEQAFVVDETNGNWGTAIEVPGTAALNTGQNAGAPSLSCPTAGNCAAGGWYTDGSGHNQAFVVSETDGNWGTAIELPGTATLNNGDARVHSVSCPTVGNCAVGGYDTKGSHHQAFVDGSAAAPPRTVECSQTIRPASPADNLSGVWKSNQGGTYYLRQIGSCLYWIGLGTYNSTLHRYDYANAYFATVSNTGLNTIKGYWFDVNAGSNNLHGQLTLKVVNPTKLTTTAALGGFGGASWTRQTASPYYAAGATGSAGGTCYDSASAVQALNYLPSTVAFPNPDPNATTARYNVRQVGSCVVFWGRPKVSPVPNGWTSSPVFFGHSTGSGLSEVVHGMWADLPAGTDKLFGKLTLTVTGTNTFTAVGTGGWSATTLYHTP